MIKKILFILALILQANITYSQDTVVIDDEIKKEESVPFAVIEEVPVFPGCGEVVRNKKMDCFQEKLNEHIVKNFNYPKEARKKKIKGRVSVLFTINREGKVEITSTKAPKGCELLEAEAIRIIRLLPKMEPGKIKGKAVSVKYAQPIIFNLN